LRGWSYHLGTARQKKSGSAINVLVWHQSTELINVKSDGAAAAATARWAGEAALRNATNTATKDATTTASACVRGGPSPLEPPATDVGAKATTTNTTTKTPGESLWAEKDLDSINKTYGGGQ